MLQPKKVKFRKPQKGRMKGYSKRGTAVSFGSYGLKALENAFITSRQLEACRVVISRTMKREGKSMDSGISPEIHYQKPAEVRMGKGKGNPEYWAAVIKPGAVLFELDGVPESVAKDALKMAADKLPIKTKFVYRRDIQTD